MHFLFLYTLIVGLLLGCTKERSSPDHDLTLRVPITAIPDLDRERGNEVNANKVVDNVFEHLVGVDQSLSPFPEVASKWTIRHDKSEIEFEIDQNKRFHDGSPVLTQDVLNSLLEAYRNKNEILSQFKSLEGCLQKPSCDGFHTIDRTRFVLRIRNKNYPLLMKKLASAKGCIVKRVGGNYFGTGPYKIAQVDRDQIVAEKFDDRAIFKKIIYQKADSDTALRMFLKGELDTISDIESSIPRKDLPDGLSFSQKIAGTYALVFSFKRPVFKKVENRLAVASVIEQERFHEYAPGDDIPAGGMIPRGYFGHRSKTHSQDVASAKQLIEKHTLATQRIVILGAREKFRGNKAVEEYLVDRFKGIGLKLKVEFVSFDEVLRGFRDGRFDMIMKGDSPINFDPSTSFDGYVGEEMREFSGYHSPALNRLLLTYEGQTAKEDQLKTLHAMEDVFAKEIPAIPLFYPVFTTWFRKGLTVQNAENISVKFWDFSYHDVRVASVVRKKKVNN